MSKEIMRDKIHLCEIGAYSIIKDIIKNATEQPKMFC